MIWPSAHDRKVPGYLLLIKCNGSMTGAVGDRPHRP